MPRPLKTPDEEISRGEASILLEYITVTMKKPHPKGGFLHFLHRTPEDIAKEYGMTARAVLIACRRKLAEGVKV